MATAMLSSKGQITLPKVIRDKFHLEPGDRIEFLEDAQGVVTIVPACENVTKLKGMIKKSAPPVSLEAMNEQILRTGQLRVEQPQIVRQALKETRTGKADFADHLNVRINITAGCLETVTFDKALAQNDS